MSQDHIVEYLISRCDACQGNAPNPHAIVRRLLRIVRLAYAFIGNQIGQLAEQFISLGAGPGEKIGQLVLAGSRGQSCQFMHGLP